MGKLSFSLVLIALTVISACSNTQELKQDAVSKTDVPHTIGLVPYSKPIAQDAELPTSLVKGDIAYVANHVAQWQLAQFDIRSNKMRAEKRSSGLPSGWIYATFDIGLWRWADAIKSETYYQTALNLALLNDFKLGPRIYHADDHAIGDMYLSIYNKFGGDHRIENTIEHLTQVVEKPSTVSLEFVNSDKERFDLQYRKFHDPKCTSRWCWADAVFMSPPVMAHLSKTTGDDQFIDFMDKEFWLMTDYLFDKDYQLYLRDSRYFSRKDEQNRPIFWGRGNGWVLAGLARVLEHMPSDYHSRPRYIALFKELSVALLRHQNPDGSWPSSLLEKGEDSHSETSATGLLTFGLAWGINQGILTDASYRTAVESAWTSIVRNIEPDGKVGYVQQVAFAPGSAKREDTQLYGSGAVLLAASELYKLLDN